MPIEIRPFARDDTDEILSLAGRLTIGVAAWRPSAGVAVAVRGWVSASLADVAEDRPVWVAEVGGKIVGFVTAGSREHWSGERDGYVGGVVVHEDHSGQGIGTALMARAEDWARGRGFARLRLETGNASDAAKVFYAGRGYVIEEVVLTKPL